MGADGSPTEELDRVAEAQVISETEAEGVDWDILSEEIGLVHRGGRRMLVVDPVDGSHNALRGMPGATVSLALGNGTLGGIDLGVVHDLGTGSTFWAVRGDGAYRDGHRIRPRRWESSRETFFLNLGRHSTARVTSWVGKGRRVRSLGCASFEMSMVAQGAGDVYIFENDSPQRNLRVTDIAAGYRILLEAGGGALDATGSPLESLPLDLDHHTSLFAYGDPEFPRVAKEAGFW
jgi:fructose-1,6-bisphosphatase/inositol monophosphatase family enzyme